MSGELLFLAFGVGAVGVLSLGLGSLIRYARTRRVLFLIAGLLLSAGLGVFFFYLLRWVGLQQDVFYRMTNQIDGPWPTP